MYSQNYSGENKQQQNQNILIDDQEEFNGFSNKTVRLGFIRKVLALFTFQISITFISCVLAVVYFDSSFIQFIIHNIPLMIVCLIINIFVLILINCTQMGKKTPTNYILMTIFVASFTIQIMSICAYSRENVLLALGLTLVVCLTLTVYALTTKKDFTLLGGGLAVALVVIIALSLVTIFLPSQYYKPVHLLIAGISLIVMGLYFIHDLQLIVGGKKHSYDIDDYVMASLNLYVDTIQIFIEILKILNVLNSRDQQYLIYKLFF